MTNINWTQTALNDLAGIRDFISRDSVYYAEKFVDDTFQAVEHLQIFPKSGRVVPERNDPTFREIIFGSYRIMYSISSNDCNIVTMIHCKRGYD
jgi:plasmid stabilization system protein ParE